MSEQAFSKAHSHFNHWPFEKMVRTTTQEEYHKDFFNCDKLTYEVDVQFEKGILNLFFRSVSKNPYDGSYVLQLWDDGKVRLLDFKGDYTFAEQPGALEKADSYHVKVELDGRNVTVTINDKEYIKRTITEEDRQYKNGYVALGIFNGEAHFQNFYAVSGGNREGNIKTNLKDFESVRGYWYVDGEDYVGTLPDNAFLYSDYIDSDHFTYTADAKFNTNCLNLIFQSQAKDPWAGCYALQVHVGEKKVRLFDFKGDVTFAEVRDVLPEAESYHIEIRVDGLYITAKVNGVEYINTTIKDTDHLYHSGYVALGFWNTEARFRNFYVREHLFTDVQPNAYYADAVTWAYKRGVTAGATSTTFQPLNNCSRAEFVTLLWQAAEKQEPTSTVNKFSDVSETAHADYYKAILWAAENGITLGTGNGSFSPDAIVTRAEAVTLMHRYAQKAGIATKTGVETFNDVTNEGAMTYCYDAIGWAQANGISKGIGAGNFGPADNCTRGEMVTFLYRLFAEITA